VEKGHGVTLEQVDVLGVRVHAIDMARALDAIADAVAARRKGYVCLANVHSVMEAQDDPELMRVLNGAYLTLPDGRPLVWIGRLSGHEAMEQVRGPDLIVEACRALVPCGATHYLYGGAPGVAEDLERALARKAPGARLVGTFTPPFRALDADERRALAEEVARVRPDIIWVGLGAPKQERFCAENLADLDATLLVGVGAAFDFHTGRIHDSPVWVQRAGLQWVHRLVQDPTRMGPRYLRHNPRFLARAAAQLAGQRRAR